VILPLWLNSGTSENWITFPAILRIFLISHDLKAHVQKALRAALNFAQTGIRKSPNQNAGTISKQQHKRVMSFGWTWTLKCINKIWKSFLKGGIIATQHWKKEITIILRLFLFRRKTAQIVPSLRSQKCHPYAVTTCSSNFQLWATSFPFSVSRFPAFGLASYLLYLFLLLSDSIKKTIQNSKIASLFLRLHARTFKITWTSIKDLKLSFSLLNQTS